MRHTDHKMIHLPLIWCLLLAEGWGLHDSQWGYWGRFIWRRRPGTHPSVQVTSDREATSLGVDWTDFAFEHTGQCMYLPHAHTVSRFWDLFSFSAEDAFDSYWREHLVQILFRVHGIHYCFGKSLLTWWPSWRKLLSRYMSMWIASSNAIRIRISS